MYKQGRYRVHRQRKDPTDIQQHFYSRLLNAYLEGSDDTLRSSGEDLLGYSWYLPNYIEGILPNWRILQSGLSDADVRRHLLETELGLLDKIPGVTVVHGMLKKVASWARRLLIGF